MADNPKRAAGTGGLQITSEGATGLEETGHEQSERMQGWAKQLVSSLYMLVRSVKMYDPDNAIFGKPVELLRENINQIIAKDGQLQLQIIKETFYVNSMLVKIDHSSLDNIRELITEMRERKVGGFTLTRAVTGEELRNFIAIFARENKEEAGEEGLQNRKLMALKLAKWSKMQEKVKDIGDDDDQKIDRKKYALTVYGRLVFFVRKYIEYRSAGKPMTSNKAMRLVQDMVDICYEQRTHFLGMTTFREDDEYIVYHSVNVTLLVIIFGAELGLTKPQLRDLAMAALFHDIGKSDLPPDLAQKKGALTDEEREIVNRSHLASIKAILREGLSRSASLKLITTYEYAQDFGTAVKDPRGGIQMILPKGNLSLFSRILAVCVSYDALTSKRPFRDAYGPEIALLLMWTEMRAKFDSELLKVFMKVMAIQPIKLLPKYKQNIALG
jgi:HD-GYP domain-containing protein (c-di-GMP phosphodiesterase class II)